MIFWLVFLVVFVGALLTFAGIQSSKISSVCKSQENINNQIKQNLKDFNVSKEFHLSDNFTFMKPNSNKKIIAVDSENEKILLVDYEKCKMIIVSFKEILNYEIYENGSHITTGIGAGGGYLGVFGAETSGNCKDLRLIIRLDRVDNSQVCYDLISDTLLNTGISKSSKPYQECVKSMQEVVSFLEVVKNRNKQ